MAAGYFHLQQCYALVYTRMHAFACLWVAVTLRSFSLEMSVGNARRFFLKALKDNVSLLYPSPCASPPLLTHLIVNLGIPRHHSVEPL
jgi:hypothetical protein